MKHFLLSLLCLSLFFCAKQQVNPELQEDLKSSSSSSSSEQQNLLFWDGKSEMLRGVAIGNSVWSLQEYANLAINDSSDYARLRADGFNAVRFYLSYKFFENDSEPYSYKQGGWLFLDRNIELAKENGIKLILNMHVPQGGFQSNGEGGALWDVEENQKRLIALWNEIAKRYANETSIAAYDILNEPVVSKGKYQWQKLAQEIVNVIREVDNNHLILVERMNAIIPHDYSNDSEMNFIFVEDPANKWGLTFHFYSPIEYTHQYASWSDFFRNTDGGTYPDLNGRNKAFLEKEVDSYLKIAQEKNLPIYLGEFGVIEATLNKEKGGFVWISDMLDILKTRNVSFTYHAWVDGSFGVKDRHELESLFRNKFFGRR